MSNKLKMKIFCRCCLSTDTNLIEMKDSSGEISFFDTFLECSSVGRPSIIPEIDDVPMICAVCVELLKSTYYFQLLCRTADKALQNVWHEVKKPSPAKKNTNDVRIPSSVNPLKKVTEPLPSSVATEKLPFIIPDQPQSPKESNLTIRPTTATERPRANKPSISVTEEVIQISSSSSSSSDESDINIDPKSKRRSSMKKIRFITPQHTNESGMNSSVTVDLDGLISVLPNISTHHSRISQSIVQNQHIVPAFCGDEDMDELDVGCWILEASSKGNR